MMWSRTRESDPRDELAAESVQGSTRVERP